MDLEELYELAYTENIPVYNWFIKDCYGCYMECNNKHAIGLNFADIDNSIEEKCILAEELGHCFCGAVYPLDCTDLILISKNEYKAKKWSYNILTPYNKIKEAIAKEILTIYDLADSFNVSYEYMHNCLEFYINKYGQI